MRVDVLPDLGRARLVLFKGMAAPCACVAKLSGGLLLEMSHGLRVILNSAVISRVLSVFNALVFDAAVIGLVAIALRALNYFDGMV